MDYDVVVISKSARHKWIVYYHAPVSSDKTRVDNFIAWATRDIAKWPNGQVGHLIMSRDELYLNNVRRMDNITRGDKRVEVLS